jgi:hypothetical protein
MCWRAFDKKYTTQKVAEDDIPVFKIVVHKDNKYQPTYYTGMVCYMEGQTYALGDSIKVEVNYDQLLRRESAVINKGFHSYNYKKLWTKLENVSDSKDCVFAEIRTIDHNSFVASYISEPCEYKFKMNCIIPKGTTYYENEYSEMVSECIKVINFEPLKIHEE